MLKITDVIYIYTYYIIKKKQLVFLIKGPKGPIFATQHYIINDKDLSEDWQLNEFLQINQEILIIK